MIDLEKIQEEMYQKISAIPVPDITKMRKAKEKNRENVKHLHEDKLRILNDRKSEALRDGDGKKKYACIAVERDEKGQYNITEQIDKITTQMKLIEKNTPDWETMKFFSVINNDTFWKNTENIGYTSELDKDKFYIGMGFSTNQLRKLKDYIKLMHKKRELEKII